MLSALYCSAQINRKGLGNLPPKLRESFERQHGKSSEVSWTILNRIIVVSFKEGDIYKEAFYTPEGEWKRTETPLDIEKLPAPAIAKLNSDEFKAWHKGSAYLMELPGKKIRYKVYIYSADWNELEIIFNDKGQRLTEFP